ncbi:MAG: T9SS type A sorting domain-containing protein [Lentimicrobiaceae bacterium]|nr:T9SS type A sorting domain-containing protein [Lentimicrobiaceae bacterium]
MKTLLVAFLTSFLLISEAAGQEAVSNRINVHLNNGGAYKTERPGISGLSDLTALQKLERIRQLNNQYQGADWAPNSKHRLDSAMSVSDFKDVYTYNAFDQLTEEISYFFESALNQWLPSYRTEYTYNPNWLLLTETEYAWDEVNSLWEPSYKLDYTFNANNVLVMEISSYWDGFGNSWMPASKSEYSYLSNGEVNEILYYYYDWSSVWLLTGKDEYTYNTSNQLLHYIYYFYDSFTLTWQQESKTAYVFNASGDMILLTEYEWESSINNWIATYKTEYTYGTMGNLQTEIAYDYDYQSNTWIPSYKSDYNYNLSVPLSDLIVPFWYTWDYMITSLVHSTYVMNQWVPMYNVTLYYTVQTSAPSLTAEVIPVRIFPNPVADFLDVNIDGGHALAELTVIDSHGRVVRAEKFEGKTRISMEGLSPALYVYRVVLGSEVYSGKLIKN